jgi:hypothetical protein
VERGAYDPETLNTLRAVLDEAWSSLSSEQQARISKSEMALRILRLAQRGERDPGKLRAAAILEVFTDKRPRAKSNLLRQNAERNTRRAQES